MKFLLQKNVLLDFVFAIQKAKEWWDWWKPDEKIVEFVESGSGRDICPIGSLEFCLDYYKNLGINLKPINIPLEIIGYGPPCLKNVDIDHLSQNDDLVKHTLFDINKVGFFIKSETKFKYPLNGLYHSFEEFKNLKGVDLEDRYQLTRFDPTVENEWRIFVYDKKVVGAKCYACEDLLLVCSPRPKWIYNIVDEINSQLNLPAYTLDVAMNKSSTTPFVLEVHDFFSCGLYGFDDYSVLPYMFYRSHLKKFL